MNQAILATRNPFPEAEQLLLKLHALMRAGQGSADEAEEIRDQLTETLGELSYGQRKSLQRLSAELSMLTGHELSRRQMKRREGSTTSQKSKEAVAEASGRLRDKFESAWKRRDLEAALEHLREDPTIFPETVVAYFRARAYWDQGRLATALEFFKFLEERQPDDAAPRWMNMQVLASMGRLADALVYAEAFIADPATSPSHLVMAASVLSASADEESAEVVKAVAERVVQVIHRAMNSAPDDSWRLPAVRVAAYALLGFSLEILDLRDEAIAAYDKLLSVNPHDAAVLEARAVLLRNSDRSASLRDFKHAFAAGSRRFVPSFYLAQDAFARRDFQAVIVYAESALETATDPRLRAILLERTAIATLEVSGDVAGSRRLFDEALKLAPDEKEIRVNHERFERRVHSMEIRKNATDWQSDPPIGDARLEREIRSSMRTFPSAIAASTFEPSLS